VGLSRVQLFSPRANRQPRGTHVARPSVGLGNINGNAASKLMVRIMLSASRMAAKKGLGVQTDAEARRRGGLKDRI